MYQEPDSVVLLLSELDAEHLSSPGSDLCKILNPRDKFAA